MQVRGTPCPAAARRLGAMLATAMMALALASCGGGSGDAALAGASSAAAPQANGLTDQIIVQPSDAALLRAYQARAADFAQALSGDAGVRLTALRQTHAGAHVLALPTPLPMQDVAQIAQRLAQRGDVAYAEPDVLFQPTAIPNDTSFVQQWHLREPTVSAGGINAVDAWDLTTGDPNLVVAVVDSGVLRHQDLGGRLLAGYDFIANTFNANDGNARDVDATDAGDWLTAAEAAQLDRTAKPSSWHGTHVAGTIAATGNNGFGVSGINWKSKILPVRVLGKGGGYLSDIADGIVWAAGGSVPGIPANTTPARVINLSMGAGGTCSQTTQAAISYAVGQRAVVVVAAGNESTSASSSQPANCSGVIAVGAVGARGQMASYSNFGAAVALSAPGGDPGNDSGVLSLGDTGQQRPVNDSSLLAAYGTSMAAPHVAGVASLILSVNPALGPADVKAILQSTARAFPTGTGHDCSPSLCGAGIVNAGSAVRAAANATAGVVSAIPQSGVWWNPAESGRGYVIEIRDGKLNFGGYLYDESGRATWVASGPAAMLSNTSYSGTLESFSGGQTLTSAYKAPTGRTPLGNVSIQFTSQTTATLTWPGGTVPIQRFRFNDNSGASTGFMPEAGVWWNPAESGRGFAIEVQNGSIYVAGFMYDATGNPTWHLAGGPLSASNTFSGSFVQFAGGQTLAGAYRQATVANPNVGSINLRFIDTANAVMTLPDGRSIPLEKFRIGGSAPGVVMPINQILTAKMIGVWSIRYTISTDWEDTFLFNEVRESETDPGRYNVWGINQYDSLAVGGWQPDLERHTILAPGFTFDDFYVFDMPTDASMTGCYYLAYYNPTRLSKCYPLVGSREQEIAPLQTPTWFSPSVRPRMDLAARTAAMARENAQIEASPAYQTRSPALALRPEVAALHQAVTRLRATAGR